MPVNDGTGSQISFSDLQTAFGGMHPISLSEYYRGGEVGTTRTVVAANSGVSGAVTRTIPGTTTTTDGALTTSTPANSGSFTVSPNNLAYVRVTQGGRGNHIMVQNRRQRYSASQDDLPTSTIYFAGPNFRSSDTTSRNIIAFNSNLGITTGGVAGFTGFTNAQIGRRTVTTTTSPTTYDVTYTNNTSFTINNISTPQGTIASLGAGLSHTFNGASTNALTPVTNDATTATDANSNIPSSGQVSMNQYNSITNYTPG